MGDNFEVDPEVAADIAKRDASERDRTRKRDANYGWTKPIEVAQWPCRGRCGAIVGVTQEAVDALATGNRRVEQLGQIPIEPAHCVFCADCRARGQALVPDRNRKHSDRMASLIRDLRGGTTSPEPPGPPPHPAREVELIREIRSLGHPDVEGLVQTVRERRRAGGKRKGDM
jgi:hypothetical protein